MFSTLISLILFFQLQADQPHPKKRLDYQVVFVQNDSILYPDAQNSIYLNKAPFEIKVFLNYIEGVYVNISPTDDIYKLPFDEEIPELNDVPSKCMASEKFNASNELIISRDNFSYWYYDRNDSVYRFNEVIINSDENVTGIMRVNSIFNADTKTDLALSGMHLPLYFTFFSTSGDYHKNEMRERQRNIYQVRWKD